MNSAFLRRLIFTFLALSLIVGGASLLWPKRGAPARPSASGTEVADSLPSGGSAFVESLPGATNAGQPSEVTSPAPSYTDNLTDSLAQALASQTVKDNPLGPQGAGDSTSINVPDVNAAVNDFLNGATAVKNVAPANLAKLAPSRIITNPSPQDFSEYLASLHNILQTSLYSESLQSMLDADPSPETLNGTTAMLDKAIQDLSALRVPKSLEDLHVAAGNLFLTTRGAIVLSGGGDDPLKNLLLSTSRGQEALVAAAEFQGTLKQINFVSTTSYEKDLNSDLSWLDKILGTRRASAQLPGLVVPVFDPAVAAAIGADTAVNTASKIQKILEWGRKLATEFVKDRIIHRLVQQIITWVQGGGKPQFVTDWKGFLSRAANDAIGNALYRVEPALCQPFQPLIRIAFTPVNLPPEQPVMCTLDQIVQNMQNFYGDFSNGGWIAYGAALRPENNFWGVFIQTSDILTSESAKAKQAAQNEAVAGQGFTDSKRCIKWGYKSGSGVINFTQSAGTAGTLPSTSISGYTSAGQLVCLEYESTTPGSVISSITNTAINSPISRIVNAQDLAALASAVANSALNKLLQAGQTGLSHLLYSAPDSSGKFPDVCTGLSGSERTSCQNAACYGLSGQDLTDCEAGSSGGATCDTCAQKGLTDKYQSDVKNAANEYLSSHPEIANEPSYESLDAVAQLRDGVIDILKSRGFMAKTIPDPSGNPYPQMVSVWKSGDPDTTDYRVVAGGGVISAAIQAGYCGGHSTFEGTDIIPAICTGGGAGATCDTSPNWSSCQAPDHTDLVRRVKDYVLSKGIDISGNCGALEITKRVAWALRGEGAGGLHTFHSSACSTNGLSSDLVGYPDGSVVDVLGATGEANNPQWLPSPGPITESGVYYVSPTDPGDPAGSY